MRNQISCDLNTGKCRPATEEEILDWDRRVYLETLISNPDDPRLQHR